MVRKSASPSSTAKPDKSITESSATENLFPVVGVGASAGGLSAFTSFLKALPPDTDMAFVLVQHLDPKHASLLPELMARTTTMRVAEVSDGMRVEPNHIYVMPPNCGLAMLNGVLYLMPRPEKHVRYLPIDDFLNSLAQDRKHNAIGVILSGTASDGTLGLQAIKAAGGITFAQSEDSADFIGMPHSAIAAGYVDFILAPKEIAEKLAQISGHAYMREKLPSSRQETITGDDKENIQKIIVLLRAHSRVDFTYYKQNTIQRRIKRRMMLHQLSRIKDYVKFLQTHPKEQSALFQDILITVTNFFRDPETFSALKRNIFPRLVEGQTDRTHLRIWVPACATGEEAYSLVMTLIEFLAKDIGKYHIQVFGTDIDEQAIDRARKGIYSIKDCENIEKERLERFFIKTETGYQISKSVRDLCLFAVQNAIQDPPFSHLDLVCCRNLMIYLGPTLQKIMLRNFHYALQPNGYLMLGKSESIGNETDLFSTLDTKNKIYICKPTTPTNAVFTGMPHYVPSLATTHSFRESSSVIKNSLQQEAEKLILEKYALSGVIINQDMEILHFCGQTAPYIEPSAGSASLNLLRMARQDLMLELRLAVKQAIKKHNKVRREVVRILENGDHQSIVLHVIPLSATEPSKLYFLVLFDSDRKTAAVRKTGKLSKNNTADIKDVRIRELEHEMLEEQKHLQSIIEDQEATNQELQSASEEIQSTNEELQSTNEELETAKEELQSSNEELATVIEEHEIRNHELNAANSKLTNLLSNIDVATIILDRDRKILCFTAAAKPLLNLIDSDIGRPVSNIHHNFDVPDLEKKLKQVIETTIPWSSDFNDRNEHWYKITLRPYITINNYVDGVVMTLVNIDSNKNVERLQLALLQEKRLSTVVRDSSDTIMVLDFSNHILAWNRRAEEVYGYNEEEALRLSANELFPEKTRKEMQNLFERLQCSKLVPPGESLRCTKDGNVFKVWLTASVLLNGEHKPYAVAITEKEIL